MPDIFLESPRFPGCPSAGFTSDAQYRVVITRRASGVEKRNRAWTYPLTQLTVTIGPRAEDEIQEVLEFYHSVGQSAVAFRVKDYSDWKSCHVGFTPSAADQPLLSLGGGVYQLIKRYQFGIDQDGNPVTQDRPIYKPVVGTVLLSGAGSVDYETGQVSGSGGGTAGFEFDVPCRFDSGLPVEVLHQQIQSVTFALIEVRMSGAVG